MTRRRAVLVAAALALPLTAPPAHAAPGCGGHYTTVATCQFTVSEPSLIVVKGTAVTNGRSLVAHVAVGAYRSATRVASCAGSNLGGTHCERTEPTGDRGTYTCRVAGLYAGTYSCVAIPLNP